MEMVGTKANPVGILLEPYGNPMGPYGNPAHSHMISPEGRNLIGTSTVLIGFQ